ncbi:MAG: decarboxylating NADP(+)-dependent phosphogluconate dehydrogenase [Balneolaceae bacterium]
MEKSDIGVFGLGVMGKNLALNLEQNKYRVSVYNRVEGDEKHVTKEFIESDAKGKNIQGTSTPQELVSSLNSPRIILLMVSAGKAVDAVINQLLPYLDKGDILIDGGNTYYPDTIRRTGELSSKEIYFIGMGVSGGEEGARFGPSLMPGGSKKAYEKVEPILKSIAAKTRDGFSCCTWMGEGGAGHFVKMVHNGIEYADMQMIAETCHILKNVLGMNSPEIADVFRKWNRGKLNSYLTEITADIFNTEDEDGTPLVDKILDAAKQKGTGRWTVISALEMGIPVPVTSEALFSRTFSGLKDLRSEIALQYKNPEPVSGITLGGLEDSLFASRIMAHAEGLFMIRRSCDEQGWKINLADVTRVWQAGCIIRSSLLQILTAACTDQPDLRHLILSPLISSELKTIQKQWRETIGLALSAGIPVPAMAAALSEFDTLRTERLPANVIQAQRDYFGAHTYERVDYPRGSFFHSDWVKKEK